MKINFHFKQIFRDPVGKIFCLICAIAIVFSIRFATNKVNEFEIDVNVILPAGYEAQNIYDTKVNLKVLGDPAKVYLLRESDISAVADFSVIGEDTLQSAVNSSKALSVPIVLEINEEKVSVSEGLDISTEPGYIKILFRKTGD